MQITRFRRCVSAFAAIVMTPLAGAQECSNTAPSTPAAITYVHYEQLGACVAFYEGETPVFANQAHAFVIFRITKIVNTDPGSIMALVQPDHFFIQGNPDDTAIGYYSLQWVRPKPMPVVYVDPGKTAEPRGTILIDVDFDWGDPLDIAKTQPFLLQYVNGPSAQGIILVKDNLDKVAWARTGRCHEIEQQPGQGAI
jgi:hypothetical protein